MEAVRTKTKFHNTIKIWFTDIDAIKRLFRVKWIGFFSSAYWIKFSLIEQQKSGSLKRFMIFHCVKWWTLLNGLLTEKIHSMNFKVILNQALALKQINYKESLFIFFGWLLIVIKAFLLQSFWWIDFWLRYWKWDKNLSFSWHHLRVAEGIWIWWFKELLIIRTIFGWNEYSINTSNFVRKTKKKLLRI